MVSNLRQLIQFSNRMISLSDMKETILYAQNEIARLFNSDKCRIFIFDYKEQFSFQQGGGVDYGQDGAAKKLFFYDGDKEVRFCSSNEGIIGRAINENQILKIKDCYKDPDFNGKSEVFCLESASFVDEFEAEDEILDFC